MKSDSILLNTFVSLLFSPAGFFLCFLRFLHRQQIFALCFNAVPICPCCTSSCPWFMSLISRYTKLTAIFLVLLYYKVRN